jgi:hypothetical protein
VHLFDEKERIFFSCLWQKMTAVEFSNSNLPSCPSGQRLKRITYRTCPGSDLQLMPVKDVDGTLDSHGVPADAWWVCRCSGLPDRTMRLTLGSRVIIY